MSANMLNIPNGSVLVPVQLQSGGSGSGSVPGSIPDARLLEFKRSSPQALGTVQIMVAVMLFLFGLTQAFYYGTSGSRSGPNFAVLSGVFVWAPLFYIIAGSLTVAADRSMSRCMIKGSMGMNIVAAMMSFIAIILYGLTAGCKYPYMFMVWFMAVQCVFNLLVFIISLCVSVFGCKATCCQETPILQAVVVHNHLPPDAEAFLTTAQQLPLPESALGHSADALHSLPEETYYSEVDHTLSEPLLPKAVGSAVG